jgi:hypothetical protein
MAQPPRLQLNHGDGDGSAGVCCHVIRGDDYSCALGVALVLACVEMMAPAERSPKTWNSNAVVHVDHALTASTDISVGGSGWCQLVAR